MTTSAACVPSPRPAFTLILLAFTTAVLPALSSGCLAAGRPDPGRPRGGGWLCQRRRGDPLLTVRMLQAGTSSDTAVTT